MQNLPGEFSNYHPYQYFIAIKISCLDYFFFQGTRQGDKISIPQITCCTSHYSVYFSGSLYIVQGLTLIFGAFLTWETRHVCQTQDTLIHFKLFIASVMHRKIGRQWIVSIMRESAKGISSMVTLMCFRFQHPSLIDKWLIADTFELCFLKINGTEKRAWINSNFK